MHEVARAVDEVEPVGTEDRSVVDQQLGDVHAGEDGDAELRRAGLQCPVHPGPACVPVNAALSYGWPDRRGP